MTTVYGDLVRYRELFGNLLRRDVQAKYRGSLLGVAWTLANPVLLMAVYLLVFSVLWKTPFGSEGHYALFLLVGLAAWLFFAQAVQSASRSLLDNANLIRKTRFPRQLVPLSVVATHLISFARDARDPPGAELRVTAPRACDGVARRADRGCRRGDHRWACACDRVPQRPVS